MRELERASPQRHLAGAPAFIIIGLQLVVGCGDSSSQPLASGDLPPQRAETRTERLALPGLPVQDVTYEIIDGQAVLEGDIVLDLERYRVKEDSLVSRTTGYIAENNRWTDAVVPYTIDGSLSPSDPRILGAIAR